MLNAGLQLRPSKGAWTSWANAVGHHRRKGKSVGGATRCSVVMNAHWRIRCAGAGADDAWLLAEWSESFGFAPPGEFLLALPQKEPKALAPSSSPALRAGFLRSIAAPRGRHEWAVHGPIMPFAASCGSPLCTTTPLSRTKGAIGAV